MLEIKIEEPRKNVMKKGGCDCGATIGLLGTTTCLGGSGLLCPCLCPCLCVLFAIFIVIIILGENGNWW